MSTYWGFKCQEHGEATEHWCNVLQSVVAGDGEVACQLGRGHWGVHRYKARRLLVEWS